VNQLHYRACNLCEAICGIVVERNGAGIASIRGDPDDPLSRGHICPKAVALQDLHEDPDRLRTPLARRGGSWVPVSWEEAFAEASERLADVRRAHGRNAVAVYQGNPTVHNHGALIYAQLFVQALGTRSRYSATSVDQLPHMLASLLMFGHQLLLPVPDLDRTQFLLTLGANPLASNGSLMTAPGVRSRLLAMKKRGGRLVVVDPRRTETAALADQHLFVRPGSDALLLMALVRTLFEEGLVRPGRLAGFTDGADELRAASQPFAPERVAARVGIEAPALRELARAFARAPQAVAYGRVGVSTQEFGGQCCWLLNALNVLTGNLDRAGGSMFARPAVDVVALLARAGQRGHFDKGRTRVRGLPEFGGEYPAQTLAEEIETGGEGQLRALVTSAGNPVLSTPNGVRLERALARLDYMVSIDFYLNETTRHAHLILPPTSPLERDHYDLVFHALAVRNTAKYSPPLYEPGADARHDWQILLELARRLDARNGRLGWRKRLGYAALERLRPAGVVDLLLRFGPYGSRFNPFGRGLSLRRLREEPHGVDLGPLEPCLPARLYTKTRRIELAPQRLLADVARLERTLANGAANGLLLIGRRELRSNNSWMHNSERLVRGKEPCTLLMHPEDAAARGLAAGQRVRLSTRAGQVEAPLELSEAVMPGVVSLPHGWGHGRDGVRLRVASRRPGASLNDLTDEQGADVLCGTAVLNGVPVEVAACR
jgi:anaerobic selenocysteine-containing dehydrogenase